MKKLLNIADRYLEKSDWRTISILKICLFSMGVLVGMDVCEKGKKPARIAAGSIFLATYIPLVAKLVCVVRGLCCPACAEPEDEDESETAPVSGTGDESEPDPEQEM